MGPTLAQPSDGLQNADVHPDEPPVRQKLRGVGATAAKGAIPQSGAVPTLLPVLYLALWTASSSALIIMNKRLLVDDGFNFPLALTGAGQAASFLLGLGVAKSGLVALREPPSFTFYLTRLMPVVICSAGTLFFGNVAYLHLSVAFIQILKAATPAFTLTICALAGLQKPTLPLCASVMLIVLGTGLATLIESGGSGFSWLGFTYFTFSALLEAIRVVYIQLLLGKLKYDPVEILVYLGPPTAALLFGASYVWEFDDLLKRGVPLLQARPAAYLCAALMGFVVNVSTTKAIQATSSLTFKVIGCVKSTIVVACGVLLGDRLEHLQLVGYGLSVFGFVLYSRAALLQHDQHRLSSQKKSV